MSITGTSDENDMDEDQNTPIDLKGSEQHHKLKDREGERGDPEHAEGGAILSPELETAVAEGDGNTAIGEALKSLSRLNSVSKE